MRINDELIAYLEELSRLRLTPEEKAETKERLGRILRHIDKLAELDLDGVEALSQPFPAVNCFREDEARPSFERDRILAGAPEQKDGCFKAPRTVE